MLNIKKKISMECAVSSVYLEQKYHKYHNLLILFRTRDINCHKILAVWYQVWLGLHEFSSENFKVSLISFAPRTDIKLIKILSLLGYNDIEQFCKKFYRLYVVLFCEILNYSLLKSQLPLNHFIFFSFSRFLRNF